MVKLFLLLVTTFLTHHIFSQDTTIKKLDELLQAYHKLGKLNGTVLVAQHGKILLVKGYGYKNFCDSSLNDANTIYQIASVTKQFTSTLILKLVELKKLTLQDRVSKFFHGLPKGDSITIEHLLTHTSGISNFPNDSSITAAEKRRFTTEQVFLVSLKNTPLDFSPGTKWNYSNSGYMLLGYIIQKVCKMTYYDAVKKYIFRPLEMNNSAFDFIHLASKEKATGYWSVPAHADVKSATIIDSAKPFAAGAIYSTVKDLYKWHQGLQRNSVLSRNLQNKAYTPYKNNYGYGWTIDSLFGKRVVSHGGDIWGFKSNLARITEDDACIIILSNIEDPDLRVITKKLAAVLYGQPYTFPPKNEMIIDERTLTKYVGSYEVRPGLTVAITVENGHLMATTDHKEELYVQKENHFIAGDDIGQIEIEFGEDETGKVDKFFIIKKGEKLVCKKIN